MGTTANASISQTNGLGGYFFVVSGNRNKIQDLSFNCGFVIRGDENELTDLTISHANTSQDGIRLLGASENEIHNCSFTYTSTGSNRHGIYVAAGSNANTIRSNEVTGFLNGLLIGLDQEAGSTVINNLNTIDSNRISNSENHGIWLRSTPVTNTTVRGNVVFNCRYANIYAMSNVNNSGNLIEGNYTHSSQTGAGIYVLNSTGLEIISNIIGSDVNETDDLGNFDHGIVLDGGSDYKVGGIDKGNLIVFNGNSGSVTDGLEGRGHGIMLMNGVTNSAIQGNIIGTNRTGTQDMGNDMSGIYIERLTESPATNDGNLIGGDQTGEGNLIGNNGSTHIPFLTSNTYAGPRSGIQLWQSHGNTIYGNLIGTNGSGSDIGNYQEAITLNGADRNQIGGDSPEKANVLTNSINGIAMRYGSQFPTNVASDDNIISGNLVGTDAAGNTGLGNDQHGISVETESSGNQIGGTTELEGNLVVATTNGPGIWVTGATNTLVYYNKIGNVTNTVTAFENGGSGILVESGASSNKIGTIDYPNTIAYKVNSAAAISVSGSTSDFNTIVGNQTFCNAGKGIELNNTGNDNFASSGSGDNAELFVNNASVAPVFFGVAPANSIIDVYELGACSACSDVDGGTQQGSQWLGATTADANGDWTFDVSTSSVNSSASAIVVTATSTTGHTSEFSQCVTICTAPSSAVISPSGEQNICLGDSVLLSASPADFHYTWYNGTTVVDNTGTNDSYYANEAGTYTVVIADKNDPTNETCQVTSNAVTVITNNLPSTSAITGDDDACEGDVKTFSVTETSSSTYEWSVPTGATITTGDNTHEITVDFTGASSGDVTVVETNASTCEGAVITKSITINSLPVLSAITGDSPVCEDEQATIYSVTNNATSTFTWSVPTGASIVSGQGTNEVEIDWGNTSGNVSVTETDVNSCVSATDATLNVTVNLKPVTSGITGTEGPACNATGETYSVPLTAGSSYTWSVPTGASITAGETGPENNEITVDFGSTNGFVEVVETTDEGCTGDPVQLQIGLIGCGLNADFSGNPLVICVGESVTFTDLSAGTTATTTYAWDFGDGATPETSTSTDATITVVYNTPGSKTVSLELTEGPASDIETKVAYIVVNDTTATSAIAGDAIVCQDSEDIAFSVTNNTNSTYAWTVPSGATIVGAQGENEITVDFGTNSGVVSVIETNEFGCVSALKEFDVTVNLLPDPAGTITGPSDIVCDGQSGSTYDFSISSVTNADTLVWSVPSGATITNGEGTETITVDFGSLSGDDLQVSVEPQNECGSGTANTYTLLVEETIEPIVFMSGGNTAVCANEEIDDYKATINFVDENAVYKWYVDGVAQEGFAADSFSLAEPVDGQVVTVEVIPSIACLTKTSDTAEGTTVQVLLTPTAEAGNNIELKDITEIDLKSDEYQEGTSTTGVTYTWTSSVTNDELDNPTPATLFEEVPATPTATQTIYYLTVSNGTCDDVDSMIVTITFEPFIPTGFSPNGDMVNDGFQIHNIEYFPNNKVEIYNRWGGLVFEKEGYGVDGVLWEGTNMNGKPLPMATYYFIVKLNNEAQEEFAGPVTIIK